MFWMRWNKMQCEQCEETFEEDQMIEYEDVFYCKECSDDILYLIYCLRDVL